MSNWFKIEYLFTNHMMPISATVFKVAIALYVVFFILAIFFSIYRKKQPSGLYYKIWQKLANWSFSFSLIGMILMFFRHQTIPYLGMRGWTVIWWLICLVWLISILKYITRDLPQKKKEIEKQKEFAKYLP